MSAALIRQYFEAGQVENLVTLFEALTEQRNRAEELSKAYLKQMIDLQNSWKEYGSKAQVRGSHDTARTATASPPLSPKPKPKPESEALDLDL